MRYLLLCLLLVGCSSTGVQTPPFNADYINDKSVYWPTVHVAGKVFNVDPQEQAFDFVKNKVYDPETGIGQATHRVHWDANTTWVLKPDEKSKEEKPFNPAQLSQGHWKAVIYGNEANGKFIIERATVTARADPLAGEDPALPRVLIIGDSISMNYNDALKEALDGVANVKRIEGNAYSSNYGMQYAEYWLGNYTKPGHGWDVIQFNHGLHDLKQPSPVAPFATPIEDYKENLHRMIATLKQSGAKLIWCTTTPVPRSSGGRFGRQQGAEQVFNDAAMEVLRFYPEIEVTDLCAVVNGSEVFDNFRKTSNVHFKSPQERRLLGEAVALGIRQALNDAD